MTFLKNKISQCVEQIISADKTQLHNNIFSLGDASANHLRYADLYMLLILYCIHYIVFNVSNDKTRAQHLFFEYL